MKRELKIEGLFYLKMKEGETEKEAIERFESLIEHIGVIENNSCTTFEECNSTDENAVAII